ncbi:MAG: carbohydrate kinase family protein [bacterium]
MKNDLQKLDFVAIGDIVIDSFIRLTHGHITNDSSGKKELCMPYGEKIPFEFAEEVPAVGNSANASVSAARLGLSSGLVVNIGDDQHGQECIDRLKQEKVETEFVNINKGLKTNYHYVLWFEKDRTILIKHEDYPLSLPNIGSPKMLYLSSLSEKSLPFHDQIADYLDAHPEIRLVFQPGTYQIKFGATALKRIYKHTELFFCNVEEAQIILGTESHDLPTLLAGIKTLGPKIPVITDGSNGSYTYIDGKVVHLAMYPDVKPAYERTGAGDAFASTFSIAILKGLDVGTAMKQGSINSMSVCEYVGAQKGLLNEEDLMNFMKNQPEGWNPKNIG